MLPIRVRYVACNSSLLGGVESLIGLWRVNAVEVVCFWRNHQQ
jgi:hypothetical protein